MDSTAEKSQEGGGEAWEKKESHTAGWDPAVLVKPVAFSSYNDKAQSFPRKWGVGLRVVYRRSLSLSVGSAYSWEPAV